MRTSMARWRSVPARRSASRTWWLVWRSCSTWRAATVSWRSVPAPGTPRRCWRRSGCRVTTIEREPGLAAEARARLADLGYADRVDVRTGDGSLGLPEEAPWDGIVVAAAAPEIPDALREQLGDGRRLVIPVGSRRQQQLMVVERHGAEWQEHSDGACVFVPLIGGGGWQR